MKKTFYLKDAKNFPITNGIYSIGFKNSINNKTYIGSASRYKSNMSSQKGFQVRWKKHIKMLKNKNHYSSKLQNACNKYGLENIYFKILMICKPSECINKEQYFIDKYNSYKNGYNCRPLANSNLGFKQSKKFKFYQSNFYKEKRKKYYTKISNLYKENKSTREISALLNVSKGFVIKILKECCVKTRKGGSCRSIKIFQYNMDGSFIKEWNNINECCKALSIKPNCIRDVLKKRSKHAKNFYFSLSKLNQSEILKNIEILKIKSKNRKYLNIKQYDINNLYLKTWRDIKEIKEYYNCSNAIRRYINSNKIFKNFYWRLI